MEALFAGETGISDGQCLYFQNSDICLKIGVPARNGLVSANKTVLVVHRRECGNGFAFLFYVGGMCNEQSDQRCQEWQQHCKVSDS